MNISFSSFVPISSGIIEGAIISATYIASTKDDSVTGDLSESEVERKQVRQGYTRAAAQGIKLIFSGWRYLLPAAASLGRPLSASWKWQALIPTMITPFIISEFANSSQTNPAIRSIANFVHEHLGKVAFIVTIVSLGVLAVHGQALYAGVALGLMTINFIAVHLSSCEGRLATLGNVISFSTGALLDAAVIFWGGWLAAVPIGVRRIDQFLWSRVKAAIGNSLTQAEFQLPELDLQKTDLAQFFDGMGPSSTWTEAIQLKLQNFAKPSAKEIAELQEHIRKLDLGGEALSKEGAQDDKMSLQEYLQKKMELLCCHQSLITAPNQSEAFLYWLAYLADTIKQRSDIQVDQEFHDQSIPEAQVKLSEAHAEILIEFALEADFTWSEKSRGALFNAFQRLMSPGEEWTRHQKDKLFLQTEREVLLLKTINDVFPVSKAEQDSLEHALYTSFFPRKLIREKAGLSSANASPIPFESGYYAYFNLQKIKKIVYDFRLKYNESDMRLVRG